MEKFKMLTPEENFKKQREDSLKRSQEAYNGYSEKEKCAVEIMRILREMHRELKDENKSKADIHNNYYDKIDLIEGYLSNVLTSQEGSSEAYKQNGDYKRVAYELDKADQNKKEKV